MGSSVSLYVRPPRADREEGTYVELLAAMLGGDFRVTNLAAVSCDMRDAVDTLSTQLLPLAPEIVIVHLGVNEAVSRFLPRRLWRVAYGRDGRAGRGLMRRTLGLVDGAIRRWYTRLLPRAWFSEHEFETLTRDMLATVRKEFGARVCIIGITQPSPRVEAQLHGSVERVRRFNAILERCARESGADFISIDDIAGQSDLHPDGIHFSAAGHRWLAERLHATLVRG